MLRRTFLQSALAVSLSACTSPPANPRSRSTFDQIEQLIAREFAKDGRGGLTVGIVHDGELVWTRCLGFADESTRRATTVRTVYPIASVTKILTGLMLLQLVERGQAHLADPVETYVPELRAIRSSFPWAPPITLMQLATMTAGLQSGLFVPDTMNAAVHAAASWEEKIAIIIPSLTYQYEPGTTRRYSNTGYALLGLALSRAAKRPYAEYIRNEILQPLAMIRSDFAIPPHMRNDLALGYALNKPGAAGVLPWNSDTDLLLPAAGLVSDLGDLARLMRFQMLGEPETVLTRATSSAAYHLLVPSNANLRYGDGVGFSAVRDADNKLTALGHGGAFPEGFLTSYEFDGTARAGVILLANTYGGRASYKVMVRNILTLLDSESPGGSGLSELEEH